MTAILDTTEKQYIKLHQECVVRAWLCG